jgi:ribose/xylose/arabinose/galactoside ABC-type transport system permease subunit
MRRREPVELVEGQAVSKRRTTAGQSLGLVLIAAAICIVTSIVNPRFLRVQNLINIFQQISILGIVASGIGMLLIAGQIDISVGSQISLMGIILALVVQKMLGNPGTSVPAIQAALAIPVAVGVTLVLGILMGVVNGIVVVASRASSFIITLGFMTAYHGVALLSGSGTGYPMNGRFELLGRGRVFGLIPIPILFFLGAVLIAFLVLRYFRYGRFLYAIGGNRKAAFVSGITTSRITVIAFAVVGLCNALAALILISRVGFAQENTGVSYGLDALAAVIVGGVSLSGGRGNALNILLGVLLIGLISNALVIIGISPYARDLVMGLIIIIALTIAQRGSERA